jgi:hypothetical protein
MVQMWNTSGMRTVFPHAREEAAAQREEKRGAQYFAQYFLGSIIKVGVTQKKEDK